MTNLSGTLLIEFLTEELPPINLEQNIGSPFAESIREQIAGFLNDDSSLKVIVAPRRFGCVINGVNSIQKDQTLLRKGPAISMGLKDGNPQPALLGFAKSCGTDWQNLEQRDDGYFYFTSLVKGKSLDEVLPETILNGLKKVQIAKGMRWGDNDFTFVRPVHGLTVMFNDKVIDCAALGVKSHNETSGHRFMSKESVVFADANEYFTKLEASGKVIAEFNARKKLISEGLTTKASELGFTISPIDGLIDEVTALVEWPEILVGEFDKKFLNVPQECLILSMAKNQKYFALLDNNGKLTNKFLFVSNLISKDPQVIIEGNQKVLSARLADAEFFFEFDKRTPLKEFVSKMAKVVYHNKLGSQLERIERLQQIAAKIAEKFEFLKVKPIDANNTARLLKADLATEMVGEFPELQGIMGKYYAEFNGETQEVANAIEKHYYPRFSGDNLPDSNLAIVVSLADKLETLVGIWGIGLIPTGDKDPYALRRAALGIVRILLKHKIDLKSLLEITFDAFKDKNFTSKIIAELYEFILQRAENYLTSVGGYSTPIVRAALKSLSYQFERDDLGIDKSLTRLDKLLPYLSDLGQDTKAIELIQANKRIKNILEKNASNFVGEYDSKLTNNLPETELANFLFGVKQDMAIDGNYQEYFDKLLEAGPILAAFFENVMVMDENSDIKNNRLALLQAAQVRFNYICNFAELS
ncbi:MAG: glycine--tRNA ligase subunit beta [Neisseriales bacterium]|mgnify:CR=1 FL=1|nr:MAG: glycine--tRNA ligase subunit beta [Neisseriales bacterium]